MVERCSHGGGPAIPACERGTSHRTGGLSGAPARSTGSARGATARSPERRACGTDGRRVDRWHVKPQRVLDHVRRGTDGKQGDAEVSLDHFKVAKEHVKVPLVGEGSGVPREQFKVGAFWCLAGTCY